MHAQIYVYIRENDSENEGKRLRKYDKDINHTISIL